LPEAHSHGKVIIAGKLDSVLLWIKVFNFDEVNLSPFFFFACTFGIISKKSLPNPML
jgi:hypothetical protein